MYYQNQDYCAFGIYGETGVWKSNRQCCLGACVVISLRPQQLPYVWWFYPFTMTFHVLSGLFFLRFVLADVLSFDVFFLCCPYKHEYR